MVIKFSLVKLSKIFLLVILFPLIQKQWLNLYLFNVNNFSIYKFLYYLSGLVIPFFIIKNSLNHFTYLKFNYSKINYKNISGKLLLLITSIVLITLSYLITNYILINFSIILNLFNSDNNSLIQLDIEKQIIFVVITSIILMFKKTKIIIKKIILVNFFIFSLIIWYSQINNILLIGELPIYMSIFENVNYTNIVYLLSIEIIYYLWSYISYDSNLSDWMVSVQSKDEILSIINIIIFYLLMILYYSIFL